MRAAKQLIVLSVQGLVVLALAACSAGGSPAAAPTTTASVAVRATVENTTPTSIPTARPSPTQTASPTITFTATPSAKDLLSAAFSSGLSKLKTYRAIETKENRRFEVILPDRFIQFEPSPEIVKIGGTIYMKDWLGGLHTASSSNVPFMDRINVAWLQEQLNQSYPIVLLGPTTVDNSPATKDKIPVIAYSTNLPLLRLNQPKTPGANPEAQKLIQPVKIYFAAANGFPVRVEMGDPNPATVIFYDFNAEIFPTRVSSKWGDHPIKGDLWLTRPRSILNSPHDCRRARPRPLRNSRH